MTDDRLAELQGMAAKQDERARQRDTEAEARRELALLRARLLKFGLYGPDEFAAGATGKWHLNEATDQLRVWWVIDGSTFSLYEDRIYVEYVVREGWDDESNVWEWTLLDEEGQPIEWQREPPPWSSLN